MRDERLARIAEDPRYRELVRRRGRFALAYFGFVLLIAFDKALLARPIGRGVTSLGIPLGLAVILLAVLLTGVYVGRANRDFDAVTAALREGGE
jgi:uncharacterized membrane protein (DUF485 family)